MRGNFFFISHFLSFHLKQNMFFSLFKSENWRDTSKNIFYYFLDQKPFWPFLGIFKNIKQLLISNFIIGDCSLMYKKGFCKIFIIKAPAVFWKWKLCCALGCSDFWKQFWPHVMLCQIVVGPQFQNFMSLCCLFPWVQGLRKLGVLP